MSALLSNIELLGAAGCPYVQRSVALLVQHKIPFKYTQVDLYNKPQWLASKSPLLKVPALVFEGGDKPTLFESQVINEFIEDSLPADQRIVPSDPYTRATNKAWIEFGSSLLGDAHGIVSKTTKEDYEAALNAYKSKLAVFEANAPVKGPYFNGDKPALVDLAWGGFASSIYLLDEVFQQDVGNKTEYPKFNNWLKAVFSIRSVEVAAILQLQESSNVDTTKPETYADLDASDRIKKILTKMAPLFSKRFGSSYLYQQTHPKN